MSMATPVKVYLLSREAQEGVIRRFSIPDDTIDIYKYITSKVTELFQREIKENATINLKWKDDEGDLIDFSTEEEAQEAVKAARDGTLNVYVQEIPTKSSSQLVCDECNEPVSGARYVCMVCPDYNMCDTCEVAGHHLEHDMVKMVKHDISELMEFPQGPRGEFVPPPRFRRWMNRFTRRWHQRNGCPAAVGDQDKDGESRLHPMRSRRWESPKRARFGKEWALLDRAPMRRSWRRHWRNEEDSGDDSETFGRNGGMRRGGCRRMRNSWFERASCRGVGYDPNNGENGENRCHWRRRRCGKRHIAVRSCGEESSDPDSSGSRGRCFRRSARAVDKENTTNETTGDRTSPSSKERRGGKFDNKIEDDGPSEESTKEEEHLKCKGKGHRRRCHGKSQVEKMNEENNEKKESGCCRGRRYRRRLASPNDVEGINEEHTGRERSPSVNCRRRGRRCNAKYEGDRSLVHKGKRCGRRHARFSDGEETTFEELERVSLWPRRGGWRNGCGRGRWCSRSQGRKIHPGIRTWRRFAKMMTEMEVKNDNADLERGNGFPLRMTSKCLDNAMPFYGIKKGCNWRCRVPMRRRFRHYNEGR